MKAFTHRIIVAPAHTSHILPCDVGAGRVVVIASGEEDKDIGCTSIDKDEQDDQAFHTRAEHVSSFSRSRLPRYYRGKAPKNSTTMPLGFAYVAYVGTRMLNGYGLVTMCRLA